MPHTVIENLIDIVRAEDFEEEAFIRCYAETARERDLIDKLKGPGAHLLEGPRGVGKSTLLRKAEIELDDSYNTDKILGVYVDFKASLLVETGKNDIGYNPFLCWVVAKLLDALYKKCRVLQALTSDEIGKKYERLLGIPSVSTANDLERVVSDLQLLSTASTSKKRSEISKRLSDRGLDAFSNVEAVANFLRQIAHDKKLVRVNFFFDEAAHTFDEQQQATFFEFFKLLQGDVIAVKAAVYPGITSYGGKFEPTHDAVKLSFSSIDENLKEARVALRTHFRELLKKRLSAASFKKLVAQGEALDLLIILSNGNPRMFLQSVAKFLTNGEYSKRAALAASNDFVSSELVNYHMGLKKRLPRFSSHIDLGMAFIAAHLVPELQKKNQGKGDNPTVQSVYFTVDPLVPYKIQKSLTLLEYSGYLYAKSVVKSAKRKQAKRYALHLGVAGNDKVFHSKFSRNPDLAIKILSLTDYREFYSSDMRFAQLVEDYPTTDKCPNGHLREGTGDYCSFCGAKFAVDKVLLSLMKESVNELTISKFLKDTLRRAFDAKTVGDVFAMTESRLREARGIGPVRSRRILNSAEEYISG